MKTTKCVLCGGEIPLKAIKCKYCGSDSPTHKAQAIKNAVICFASAVPCGLVSMIFLGVVGGIVVACILFALSLVCLISLFKKNVS